MEEKKSKLKKIKTKFFISLFSILFIVVLLFLYMELVVNPMVLNIAYAKVDSLATTAISDAIFNVVNQSGTNYDDLVNITYDNENNISSITANMEKINFLARELSTKAQIYLDNIGQCGVEIPLGAFTGLEALSQVGPDISLRMTPIGSVITTFNTTFDSAGINQTRHSIFVDVNTVISVILPTSSQKITFVTSALVCESIIVGKVPDVYLQGGMLK